MLVITSQRLKRNWTKSELARRAGMHVSSVSQIESGRLVPYPGQVEKLAVALGWKNDPRALFEEETAC